jgi:hypothetical protein
MYDFMQACTYSFLILHVEVHVARMQTRFYQSCLYHIRGLEG